MCSEIALDKRNLKCAENIKAKPTEDDSDFITYSNTIDFSNNWLDSSRYLITQWRTFVK